MNSEYCSDNQAEHDQTGETLSLTSISEPQDLTERSLDVVDQMRVFKSQYYLNLLVGVYAFSVTEHFKIVTACDRD